MADWCNSSDLHESTGCAAAQFGYFGDESSASRSDVASAGIPSTAVCDTSSTFEEPASTLGEVTVPSAAASTRTKSHVAKPAQSREQEVHKQCETALQILQDRSSSLPVRPHVLQPDCDFRQCVFVERPKKRRKHNGDRWLNSGGKRGSTAHWIKDTVGVRKRYGTVLTQHGHNIKFYEFTLIVGDPQNPVDVEDAALFAFADESGRTPGLEEENSAHFDLGLESIKHTRLKNVFVGDDSGSAVIDLVAPPMTRKFVSFAADEREGIELGAIVKHSRGVKLESHQGDFAEWHRRKARESPFEEGEVIGFDHQGNISRNTKGAYMVGVISRSAVVEGSAPAIEKRHLYDTVAYCGVVPVKVQRQAQNELGCGGCVTTVPKAGDFLVPSGLSDGTAVIVAAHLQERMRHRVGVVMQSVDWSAESSTKATQLIQAVVVNPVETATGAKPVCAAFKVGLLTALLFVLVAMAVVVRTVATVDSSQQNGQLNATQCVADVKQAFACRVENKWQTCGCYEHMGLSVIQDSGLNSFTWLQSSQPSRFTAPTHQFATAQRASAQAPITKEQLVRQCSMCVMKFTPQVFPTNQETASGSFLSECTNTMVEEICSQQYVPQVLELGACAAAARAHGVQLSDGYYYGQDWDDMPHRPATETVTPHMFGSSPFYSGCYTSNNSAFFSFNRAPTAPEPTDESTLSLEAKLPDWWDSAPRGFQVRGTGGVPGQARLFDGYYLKVPVTCQGAPVYQLNGDSGRYALFQPGDDPSSPSVSLKGYWIISESNAIGTCDGSSVLAMSGSATNPHVISYDNPASIDIAPWIERKLALQQVPASSRHHCADSLPNATNWWQETFCINPSINVTEVPPCDSTNGCCSEDCGEFGICDDGGTGPSTCHCQPRFAGARCQATCGAHGSAVIGASGERTCLCRDGYHGGFCTLAPAYKISGATTTYPFDSNGIYSLVPGARCGAQPVYQLQPSSEQLKQARESDSTLSARDAPVLFQPPEYGPAGVPWEPLSHSTTFYHWQVGFASRLLDCNNAAYIISQAMCVDGPGNGTCLGDWRQLVSPASDPSKTKWMAQPAIVVEALTHDRLEAQ